ncbi:DUF4823 domain-containing protein [Pedosphaera parvula]|uniref:Lipoprotein n=1 Tax=Pedosphaera parvula (strain Ellin514) TaxID=320771 RepID=B9XPN1_PEDPL|nr:DUF4823 domain-containing protein [Pedosphaera parvula]EEF58154.1 hypothetical protein Cflav_PD1354 [Pedosphaera parvula Ellin514]
MKANEYIFGGTIVNTILKLFLLVAMALGIAGCKTHYDAVAEYKKAPLDRKKSGYIVVAEDDYRGVKRLKGTGVAVSDVVYQGFGDYLKSVIAGDVPRSLDESFTKAHQQECDYLIVPSIVQWVNEDNEFGKSNGNIAVSIQVYDVATQESLASVILKTKGPNSPLDDEPAQQLVEPLKAYLEALFKK